jgi:hypothetical protein
VGEVRELLDETWYVDAPQDVASAASSHAQAARDGAGSGMGARHHQVNADLITSTRPRADLVVQLLDWRMAATSPPLCLEL